MGLVYSAVHINSGSSAKQIPATKRITRKPSWRCQTRATWKHAKIAPIRRVSFHFTELHFAKFQITDA